MRTTSDMETQMLTIGVTGHRYLTEIHELSAGIDQALLTILEVFQPERIAMISSLAEGADRLVLKRALDLIHEPVPYLIIPLPFPKEEYLKDFSTTESKQEFLNILDSADEIITLPPTETRDQAYQNAGHYLLDRSDILLAVWDGIVPQGQGGTGDIAQKARMKNIPLAWIHAGNRKPGTKVPTTLGEEQGQVTFENLPNESGHHLGDNK